MPPPPHSRPENVLKRAQELIGVGQQQAALSLLHEHVVSKRTRNSPIVSLEPVMVLFVELCVDLKRGKLAKDGLYQYKNTAQNTNVGTIEVCGNRRWMAKVEVLICASLYSKNLSNLPKRRLPRPKQRQMRFKPPLIPQTKPKISKILKRRKPPNLSSSPLSPANNPRTEPTEQSLHHG